MASLVDGRAAADGSSESDSDDSVDSAAEGWDRDALRPSTVEALRLLNGDDPGRRPQRFSGIELAQDFMGVEETGGILYSSALVLMDFLEARGGAAGRVLLELGAGTGFLAAAMAKAGARVVATDGAADALRLCERNLRHNGVPCVEGVPAPGQARLAVLRWAVREEILAVASSLAGQEVTVLMSDVIYPGSDVEALGACVRLLAETMSPAPDFILSHVKRRRSQEVQFLRGLSRHFHMRRHVRWLPRPEEGSAGALYVHGFSKREGARDAAAEVPPPGGLDGARAVET